MSFANRSCNPAERNYSSYDGECLAMVWGVVHFRENLFGHTLTIQTDHQPLKWLMTTAKLTRKFARWALTLQDYDFEIVHRPRTANANRDGCSRCPLPLKEGDGEAIGEMDRGAFYSEALDRKAMGEPSLWGRAPDWWTTKSRVEPSGVQLDIAAY